MKTTYLRFLGSALGASIITICLYLLMIALIRVDYNPTEKTKTREYKTIDKLKTEITIKREIKLKPRLKKTEEPPPAPTKSTYYISKLPNIIPTNESVQAITNPLKPKIFSKASPSLPKTSELLANSEFQSKTGEHQNSASAKGKEGTSGSAGDGAGINQCSLSFTLLEDVKVADLIWQNCIDGNIANDAEDALYVWLGKQNEDFKALNAKPGDILEFTFTRQ